MRFTLADQISPAQDLSDNSGQYWCLILSNTSWLGLQLLTLTLGNQITSLLMCRDLWRSYFHSLSITADILLGYFSFLFSCNFSSSLNLADLCYDELLGWAAVTAAPRVHLEGLIENDAYKAKPTALQLQSTDICSCWHQGTAAGDVRGMKRRSWGCGF